MKKKRKANESLEIKRQRVCVHVCSFRVACALRFESVLAVSEIFRVREACESSADDISDSAHRRHFTVNIKFV